jgi:RNA polymerase sigma factor (sigma-70 family)
VDGCVDAQTEIRVEDYLALAKHVARRYARIRPGESIMDTEEYADALVGLTIAMKTYIPGFRTKDGKKVKFISWAHRCMRNEIIDNGRSRQRQRRVPTTSPDRLYRRDVLEIPDYRGEVKQIPGWLISRFFEEHPDDTERDVRCKAIVMDYYMKQMTLDAIAQEMGITRERVRQLKIHGEQLLHLRYAQIVEDEMGTNEGGRLDR